MKLPFELPRTGARLAAIAFAILLAGPAPAAARAASEEEASVRSIGAIEIRTPCLAGMACRAVFTEASIRRWLRPLVGRPFDLYKTIRRVKRHYDALGYDATVKIALVEGGLLTADIQEAPGVVGEITTDVSRLEGVVPSALIEKPEPIARAHVPMRALRTHVGDPINRERLARDRYDLAELGYDLVAVPPKPGEIHQVYVLARRPGIRRWKKIRGEMRTPSSPGPEPAAGAPPEPPMNPFRKTSISASADYSRRDLLTGRLFYKRADIFREFDAIEVSPYLSRQLAGAIVYHLPYLLPAQITERNVFVEVKAYDEFTPDRLLGGVETDEERRGGRLSLGAEAFRHERGHSLKGWVFVDRYHISFGEFAVPVNSGVVTRSGQVPGAVLNDVNIVGAGAEYAYRHTERIPDFSWVFRPTLEVATKALGGDIAFRRVKGEFEQHYAFSPGFELDARWQAGIVDRSVPVFEEFSLGGAESLRGFLRDDFLGRRFLAFQNDVWLPIPFRAFGHDSKLLAALQRNLKTAITLDAGSVSFEDALNVRFARGVGVGLRYSAETSPIVLRGDLAWGYWNGETRWYPYVSITRKW